MNNIKQCMLIIIFITFPHVLAANNEAIKYDLLQYYNSILPSQEKALFRRHPTDSNKNETIITTIAGAALQQDKTYFEEMFEYPKPRHEILTALLYEQLIEKLNIKTVTKKYVFAKDLSKNFFALLTLYTMKMGDRSSNLKADSSIISHFIESLNTLKYAKSLKLYNQLNKTDLLEIKSVNIFNYFKTHAQTNFNNNNVTYEQYENLSFFSYLQNQIKEMIEQLLPTLKGLQFTSATTPTDIANLNTAIEKAALKVKLDTKIAKLSQKKVDWHNTENICLYASELFILKEYYLSESSLLFDKFDHSQISTNYFNTLYQTFEKKITQMIKINLNLLAEKIKARTQKINNWVAKKDFAQVNPLPTLFGLRKSRFEFLIDEFLEYHETFTWIEDLLLIKKIFLGKTLNEKTLWSINENYLALQSTLKQLSDANSNEITKNSSIILDEFIETIKNYVADFATFLDKAPPKLDKAISPKDNDHGDDEATMPSEESNQPKDPTKHALPPQVSIIKNYYSKDQKNIFKKVTNQMLIDKLNESIKAIPLDNRSNDKRKEVTKWRNKLGKPQVIHLFPPIIYQITKKPVTPGEYMYQQQERIKEFTEYWILKTIANQEKLQTAELQNYFQNFFSQTSQQELSYFDYILKDQISTLFKTSLTILGATIPNNQARLPESLDIHKPIEVYNYVLALKSKPKFPAKNEPGLSKSYNNFMTETTKQKLTESLQYYIMPTLSSIIKQLDRRIKLVKEWTDRNAEKAISPSGPRFARLADELLKLWNIFQSTHHYIIGIKILADRDCDTTILSDLINKYTEYHTALSTLRTDKEKNQASKEVLLKIIDTHKTYMGNLNNWCVQLDIEEKRLKKME